MALEKKVAELTSHKDTAIEALRRESKSVHSVSRSCACFTCIIV